VTTQEQRAEWWLEKARGHRDDAVASLQHLVEERHKVKGSLEYAWDILFDGVPAVVNVDSGRLLRAVEAAWKLSDGNEPIDPAALRELLSTYLLGQEDW
jgi:hypothetical protein